jgi:hypothetical protein
MPNYGSFQPEVSDSTALPSDPAFLVQILPRAWKDKIRFITAEISLSQFRTWGPIRGNNVKFQLETAFHRELQDLQSMSMGEGGVAVQAPGHDVFRTFLLNALWVHSKKKSRHKTHVVTIVLELGHGLGEIKQLESFRVHPFSDITDERELAHIPVVVHNEPHAFIDEETLRFFPNAVIVPVIFRCHGSHGVFFVLRQNLDIPSLASRRRRGDIYSTDECVPLPPVESPPFA